MVDSVQNITPRVLEIIARDQGILDHFGMRVLSARDGVCEIRCVVPAPLVNAAGFAHGSIAFSLMDTACAYALGSLELRGVTVNGNTTYIKGAGADSTLLARVSVLSRGRRIVSLEGQVHIDGNGGQELAAHGTFMFQLIQVRQ